MSAPVPPDTHTLGPAAMEDKRLERLYDYTKFHIGIYLSAAGGIAALLGSEKTGWFVAKLVTGTQPPLYAALVFMILAGMCGAVVASSSAEYEKFSEVWDAPQAPESLWFLWRKTPAPARARLLAIFPRGVTGKNWAALEHFFFWLSLLFLAYSVSYGFTRADKDPKAEAPGLVTPCCCVASPTPQSPVK